MNESMYYWTNHEFLTVGVEYFAEDLQYAVTYEDCEEVIKEQYEDLLELGYKF